MAVQDTSHSAAHSGNPPAEAASGETNNTPIRCGVIGLGRIGWLHHSQTILKHEGFELVAVCDPQEERLEEARAAGAGATYRQMEELLADPAVELVFVASQSIDHEPMALAALQAGKHVVVEKPAAQNAAGVRRMMAAAQKAGKVLTMHHNYRLNPEYLYVREVMESGILGNVVRIKRRNQNFSRRNDWQVLRKFGGGMTGNWGIHLVDQCLCLLDSPIEDVWGDVKQVFNPGDAEDDIKALVRAESGMTLDIDMNNDCAAPEPTWVVMGDCGTLWIQDGKSNLKYFDRAELPALQVNDLPYARDRRYGITGGPDTIPWQERQEEPKPKEKYQSFYDNLYGAIRRGEELIVEPESALRTYETLDRIRAGSRFAVPD